MKNKHKKIHNLLYVFLSIFILSFIIFNNVFASEVIEKSENQRGNTNEKGKWCTECDYNTFSYNKKPITRGSERDGDKRYICPICNAEGEEVRLIEGTLTQYAEFMGEEDIAEFKEDLKEQKKNNVNDEKDENFIIKAIEDWIISKCTEALGKIDNYGKAVSQNVIFPEKDITLFGDIFTALYNLAESISYALIICALLYYGFNVYILWRDGNPEENPVEILIRYAFAIALIMCFQELYDIAGSVVVSILIKIQDIFAEINKTKLTFETSTLGFLLMVIYCIVWIVEYFKAIFHTLEHGLSLFILRMGFPLACIGLIKPNGGNFQNYTTNIAKMFLTIIVNVILLQMATCLNTGVGYESLWAISCLLLANRSNQLLNQFLVPSQPQGQGLIGKAGSIAMSVNSIKGVFGIR